MALDLAKIVRNSVALADSITASLQTTVTIQAWTGQDLRGAVTYSAAVPHDAIVDQKVKEHRLPSGQIVTTKAYIGILRPIAPNGAPGRVEPIDPRDKIVLPDGTTGPIVAIEGFIDAGTDRPFFGEVWLGKD